MTTADAPQLGSELKQLVSPLTEPERLVMWMKALVGPAAPKAMFLECLTLSRLPAPPGGWMSATVNPILERLRSAGLLDQDLSCIPSLLHPLAAEAATSRYGETMIAAVGQVLPGLSPGPGQYMRTRSYEPRVQANDAYRRLRLCFYANDPETFHSLWSLYNKHHRSVLDRVDIVGRTFVEVDLGASWVMSRAPWLRRVIIEAKLAHLTATGSADPDLVEIMTRLPLLLPSDPEAVSLWRSVAEYEVLQANPTGLRALFGDTPAAVPEALKLSLMAAAELLEGDVPAAVRTCREALRLHHKAARKRKGMVLPGIHGLLYLMALLLANDPALHAEIDAASRIETEGSLSPGYAAARSLLALARNRETEALSELACARPYWSQAEPLAAALLAIAQLRVAGESARRNLANMVGLFETASRTLPLVARILAEVLEQISAKPERYTRFLAEAGSDVRFSAMVEEKESWKRALAALEEDLFVRDSGGIAAKEHEPTRAKRLVWFVSPTNGQIEVAEQVARNGGWTAGRPVALKRLRGLDPTLDYLDDADRRAAQTIRHEIGGWYGREDWYLDSSRTLPTLVGHPRVFDARDRKTPVELVAGAVEVVVKEDPKGVRIALSHICTQPRIVIDEETPYRWRVVQVTDKAVNLAATLGAEGLLVPKGGRAQVEALLRRADPAFPVRAELEGDHAGAMDGDFTPIVRLMPQDGCLRANLVVRPAGPLGAAVSPGQGARLLSMTDSGRQVWVRRDLQGESDAAAALVTACPTLAGDFDQSRDWLLAGPAEALELLTEIAAFAGPVKVEWPQGQALSLRGQASAAALKITVATAAEWFSISGAVAVDENLVLDLKELLAQLDKAEGRFVPLSDGSFLALTRAFRTQLDRLRMLAATRGDGLRLAPVRLAALQDLFDDAAKVKGDKRWREFASRLEAAADWQPKVPATLQAELRGYQHDGFIWMMRLARWGAGACLADDMGLGKTVQAIAVLLALAAEGPSLVVAPTSVCGNWELELARFAPTLAVDRLSEAADRAEQLSRMGPGRVLIVSFGLLAREAEALSAIDWRACVLDEAQAIKNPLTRRAQAAVKLRAGFRLALSGTPVENRLDELWSLFSFANPDLLGSREAFATRFATPIEQHRDSNARQALKALVRPFLLRRTKGAVLSELPARIEKTLLIDLTEPERALYEALRQTALERLDGLAQADPSQRRIHILAELTRLRQACCHPALAAPEEATVDMPSSKLDAFLDLVEELQAGGHRALVFSQFVRHLDKVRAALDAKGIRFQYLDGSTPVPKREAAVAAFQSGDGDLFLISLKAGGFGLNLTAADYVVHLDPWWNPAVEDQASDRAHRIGQQRPVTIYRLVVRDSVEERIVALHTRKRDLADAVLEGTDTSGTLSENDLLALIQG